MTTRKTQLDSIAISLLLACCLFWGFQQVMIKATLAEVAPVFQATLRFAGAAVLLLLWCWWRGTALFARDGTLAAGVLAGLLFTAEFACLYLGLQHTTASRLTVFLYTSPFWVALFVPFWVESEKLRGLQWLGLLCAFVGVAFAMREGFGAGAKTSAYGDALALLGGMFWGLTTVVIRTTSLAKAPAEKMLFYQLAVSSLIFPVLSLALGETWVWHVSPFAMTSVVLQTAVGAFASYLTWMWLLGHYPATKISVFVFLTPLFALLVGIIWLGETITTGLLAAIAAVALGIVLVNRKPQG